MTERIVTRVNGVLRPLSSLAPGSMRLLARNATEGLILEEHECAAGEGPDTQPRGHAIAVWKFPTQCRMFWKEKRIEKAAALANGTLSLCTAEPRPACRWDGNMRMLALNIGLETMERALPEPFAKPHVELTTLKGGDPDPVLEHLIGALRAEFARSQRSRGLVIGSLANATALYLAQRYGAFPPKIPVYKSGLSRERLSRVIDYIEAHLDRDLSSEELSGVACLSPYHFGKMFKCSTAGSTIPIYDRVTGVAWQASLFVAALGASATTLFGALLGIR